MGGIKITLNHAGMDEVLKSGEVRDGLAARAEKVLAAARANAPVETGAYRDSLHVEATTAAALGISFRTGSNDRPAFIVAGGTDHDWIVEAKTGNLARALDAGL